MNKILFCLLLCRYSPDCSRVLILYCTSSIELFRLHRTHKRDCTMYSTLKSSYTVLFCGQGVRVVNVILTPCPRSQRLCWHCVSIVNVYADMQFSNSIKVNILGTLTISFLLFFKSTFSEQLRKMCEYLRKIAK